MNRCILIVCLLFVATIHVNAQQWLWAKSALHGGGEGMDVSADVAGNAYVTGTFFNDSIRFGGLVLHHSHCSGGSGGICLSSMYLVKYDPAGNVQWAKTTGFSDTAFAYHVSADAAGNVYVLGSIRGSLTLDAITTTGSGYFLAKYNTNGQSQWVKRFDGELMMTGIDNNQSNVVVSGLFKMASFTLGATTLTNANYAQGGSEGFVAKLDSSGNALWAQAIDGYLNSVPLTAGINASGDVWVGGYTTNDTIAFPLFPAFTSGQDSVDIFIARYTAGGNQMWMKTTHGNQLARPTNHLCADDNGNVYLVGNYTRHIGFGGFTLTGDTLDMSSYIVKFDPSGTVAWMHGAAHTNYYDCDLDQAGTVYVSVGFDWYAQYFMGTTYDTLWLDNHPVATPSDGNEAMYVVSYTPQGTIGCLSAISGGGDDVSGVATFGTGNVYVTGDYVGNTMQVGSTTLSYNFDTVGEEVFIARYDCNGDNAVKDVSATGTINLYPNPADNYLQISGTHNGAATVTIYDVLGKQSSYTIINNTIDISDLSPGIYILKVQVGSLSAVNRFIKL